MVTSTFPCTALAQPRERDGLRGCSLGKALCQAQPSSSVAQGLPQAPNPAGTSSFCPSTHTGTGAALPGTTPLVAIALMEMAVSIVCGKKHSVSTLQNSLLTGAEGQGSRKGELGLCWDMGLSRDVLGHGAPQGRAGTWGSLGQ